MPRKKPKSHKTPALPPREPRSRVRGYRYRSAVTGRYIALEQALAAPRESVRERA